MPLLHLFMHCFKGQLPGDHKTRKHSDEKNNNEFNENGIDNLHRDSRDLFFNKKGVVDIYCLRYRNDRNFFDLFKHIHRPVMDEAVPDPRSDNTQCSSWTCILFINIPDFSFIKAFPTERLFNFKKPEFKSVHRN